MSPDSRWGSRSAMLLSTTPAGTISQTTRGFFNVLANSASEAVPVAFSFVSSATAAADMSKTTHSWPPRMSRRTMFAPMRPRPIIPSCMLSAPRTAGCRADDRIHASRPGSFQLAIASDQRVGRAVMLELGIRFALELRDDLLGQRLAQLHAPLVEGVDLPDRALGEDAVLVERHQLAERGRRQLLQQERIRRPVALEQPVRHEPIGRAFRLDLLGGLAESQGLGLGEDIGQQHVLMRAQRICRSREGDE